MLVRTIFHRITSRVPLATRATGGAVRGYHENIVDHYENPRNVGSLDKNDPKVGTVRLLACLFLLRR